MRHVQIAEAEESDELGVRKLRERKSKPNYFVAPPQEVVPDTRKGKGGASGGRSGGGYNKIPWNSSGKELSRHLGLPGPGGDDSVSSFLPSFPRHLSRARDQSAPVLASVTRASADLLFFAALFKLGRRLRWYSSKSCSCSQHVWTIDRRSWRRIPRSSSSFASRQRTQQPRKGRRFWYAHSLSSTHIPRLLSFR